MVGSENCRQGFVSVGFFCGADRCCHRARTPIHAASYDVLTARTEDGGPIDVDGATLSAAAMRAWLIDESCDRRPPRPGGRRHAVLHGPGQLGEPEPGGDPDVSRRRAPDQVRDPAVNT